MADLYLRTVPADADPRDVRLYVPAVADTGGPLRLTIANATLETTAGDALYRTPTFLAAENSLLVAFGFARVTNAGVIRSDGLTWTERFRLDSGADLYVIYTAEAGATPSLMQAILDCTGDIPTGAMVRVFQATNHDPASPSVQTATNGGAAAVTPNIVFAAALNTNNAYACMLHNSTNPPAATPPASWTEEPEGGFETPTTGFEPVRRNGGESGTTITWGALVSSAWRVTGIEINRFVTPGAEVFLEYTHPIMRGMKPQTAAGLGGVLVE